MSGLRGSPPESADVRMLVVHTPLYQKVFALADKAEGRPLPRAAIPRIELHGPKIARRLTTEWYARRVDQRFQRCLSR